MNSYYLAIDIGASSGRHILAHLENGKMELKEIHRFPNGMVEKDGEKVWDVDELFAQIKLGMRKSRLAWALIPGVWILYFWIKPDSALAMRWLIETDVQREWMVKYTDTYRKKSYMGEPGFRSRYLILFIS